MKARAALAEEQVRTASAAADDNADDSDDDDDDDEDEDAFVVADWDAVDVGSERVVMRRVGQKVCESVASW